MESIKSLFRPGKVVKIKRPDYTPFEIQSEIIKGLPVKSLIRFRSVSKPWKSLIDSSEFIADYNVGRNTKEQRLLVRYIDLEENEEKYVSIVDDDDGTFSQHTFSVTAPMSFELFKKPKGVCWSQQEHDMSHNKPTILGNSQGLFCLYTYYGESKEKMAILWNPSIRKSVDIVVPNLSTFPDESVVGFGVCPQTSNPKLVNITFMGDILPNDTVTPWQVEIFTLSSKAWKSKSSNLPRKSIHLMGDQVVIHRFIYWIAFDRVDPEDATDWYDLIISFDLTSEEFTEIEVDLPERAAHIRAGCLSISKLRESLVVLKTNTFSQKGVFCVWTMDHGVSKSFTKLFTINITDASSVFGFRMNGEPIIGMRNDSEDCFEQLVLFDSENLNYTGIHGKRYSLYASYYIETLLLLNH